MIKFLYIFLAFFFLNENVFAFGGSYVGFGLERSVGSFRVETVSNQSESILLTETRPLSYGISLLAGYGKTYWDDIYFGIEAQLNHRTAKNSINYDKTSSYRIKPFAGLNGRVGIVSDNKKFLGYFLFGVDIAKYKFDGVENQYTNPSSGIFFGRKGGFGLEYEFSEKCKVRIERYDVDYKGHKVGVYDQNGPLKFSSSEHNVKLGFIYDL